jgi:hypothetical protein
MDPPPTEVIDLCLNMAYWLADRPDLIAAGPAQVPVVPVISESARRNMWILVTGWACLALAAGVTMMFVRRQ